MTDNIFLVPNEVDAGRSLIAKLGDFGTCWRLGDASFEEREGDGAYAAPELVQHSLNSRVTPDTHADVFSLGTSHPEVLSIVPCANSAILSST